MVSKQSNAICIVGELRNCIPWSRNTYRNFADLRTVNRVGSLFGSRAHERRSNRQRQVHTMESECQQRRVERRSPPARLTTSRSRRGVQGHDRVQEGERRRAPGRIPSGADQQRPVFGTGGQPQQHQRQRSAHAARSAGHAQGPHDLAALCCVSAMHFRPTVCLRQL